MEPPFQPFPQLETERLILRNLSTDDAAALHQYRSNPTIMEYICRPVSQHVDDCRKLIIWILGFMEKEEAINWAITLKGNNSLIGTIGFVRMKKEHNRAEVGYMLGTEFQQQGIMHEAMQAVLEYGFRTMLLHSVEAVIVPENIASASLLQKNHFVQEGFHREDFYYNGRYLNSAVYALLASEYEQARSAD